MNPVGAVAVVLYLLLAALGWERRLRRAGVLGREPQRLRRIHIPKFPTRRADRIRMAEADVARLSLLVTTLLEVLRRHGAVTPDSLRSLAREMDGAAAGSSLVPAPSVGGAPGKRRVRKPTARR